MGPLPSETTKAAQGHCGTWFHTPHPQAPGDLAESRLGGPAGILPPTWEEEEGVCGRSSTRPCTSCSAWGSDQRQIPEHRAGDRQGFHKVPQALHDLHAVSQALSSLGQVDRDQGPV